MSYDPNVPDQLKELQTWFAGVITQPVDNKNRISPVAPNGRSIEEEAARFIKPSAALKPEQRIQIYNQQYWWRLLNVMHSTYTMATRMLGRKKFNEKIAVPYIEAYPSEHYSVSHIGDRLLQWMEKQYNGPDKQILRDSIAIDDAMHNAFFKPAYPSLTEGNSPEEAIRIPAILQPYVTLFKMDYDLFNFRSEIHAKDPDYWSTHHFPNLEHAISEENGHFPKLKKGETYCFIVYRSRQNHVKWEKIELGQHALLSLFKKPTSIEQACEWLSGEGKDFLPEAALNLQNWIQGWIARQLLTPLN